MKNYLLALSLVFTALENNAQCPTSSTPTNDCTQGDYIDTFTLNAIPAIGIAGCSGAIGYSLYPTPVWNLQVGSSYTWGATCSNFQWNEGIAIWIDLNNDGFYANSEMLISNAPATTHTGTITIPFSATI